MSGDPYRASTGALERADAEGAWDRERYERGRGYEVRDEHFSHGALPVRAREPSVERYTRPHPPAASPRTAAYPDGASDISPQRYVPLPRRLPADEVYEQRYVEKDRHEVRRFSPSPPPAPRPGLLRRQSSLTTFDRLPARFYEQPPERYGPPARRADYIPPPYVPDPLPRSRQLPPVAAMPRGYYDDEDFRPVREREYVHESKRSRRRHRGRSRTRSRSRESRTTTTRSPTTTSRSSSTSSSSSSSSGGTTVKSPKNEYPKKGKTRIPARLLSKRALHDLKYPFEEDGATIVILMALGQKNIDDLLKLSEDYLKVELEAHKPPVVTLPAPAPAPAPVVVAAPHPGHGHVTAGYGAHGHITAGYGVHGHITAGSVSSADVIEVAPPVGPPLEFEETKRVSVVRETSADRSYTSGYASTSGSHYIDEFEDRDHTHIGPLILAKDGHRRRKSKSRSRSRSTRRGERAIDAEIRALEAERDAIRHGHRHRRHRSASVGGDTVRYHERLSDGSLVVYEERVEEFDDDSRHHHHHHHHSHSSSSHSRHHSRGPRIEKDKKGRMSIKIPRY